MIMMPQSRCGFLVRVVRQRAPILLKRASPAPAPPSSSSCRRSFFASSNRKQSSSTASSLTLSAPTKPKVHYLDLQNSGLSAIERLCLEEALLRHDPLQRSWAIMGTHDPVRHIHLDLDNDNDKNYEKNHDLNSNQMRNERKECIIVMGIGGKPAELLNVEKVKQDSILTIKRFSGGGTVVLDLSSLWTTFIGRKDHFPHVDPYPRNIMKWSASDVFDSVFQRMKHDALMRCNKNSGGVSGSDHDDDDDGSGRNNIILPDFKLRENDYVLGERKMGGNAQTITGNGWLHHTSFLWNYDQDNMSYLTLPSKRPDYRGDRSHDEFLVKLESVYGNGNDNGSNGDGDDATVLGSMSKEVFFHHVKSSCQESFDLEEISLNDAMKVVNDELGGMQAWFDGKCRTRIIEL